MEIVYLGHSAFRLKGKNFVVVTDPYSESEGKFPKDIDANIVTISHDHADHKAVNKVGGNPFVIDGPGEYEIGGVSVVGVSTFHDDKQGEERGRNTIYVIEMEDLRIAHAGDLGHKLTQDQLDAVGGIDVLMLPVGGVYTIDAKTAVEVVKQLDPSIVIPMHYQQPGLDEKIFAGLSGVEAFLKEIGKPETAAVNKLSISAEKLPEELSVVVLERK